MFSAIFAFFLSFCPYSNINVFINYFFIYLLFLSYSLYIPYSDIQIPFPLLMLLFISSSLHSLLTGIFNLFLVFTCMGCWSSAQSPILGGPLLVWSLSIDLSSKGGPTSSYATASIVCRIIRAHKVPYPS